MRRRPSIWLAFVLAVFIASCGADSPTTSPRADQDSEREPGAEREPDPVDLPDEATAPCTQIPCEGEGAAVAPSPSPRFARLTHRQWENTVRDLFHLSQRPNVASTFIPDPTSAGFFVEAEELEVSPELWVDYQRGAETMAARVAADPANIARLMPGGLSPDPQARKEDFLDTFLSRALRRPPTQADLARYGDLYDRAPELLASNDRFLAGVEMTVRAVLQSPHFLYRVERSQSLGEGGRIDLDGYEVAARLSYALWDSMPSDALFEAAANGELNTVEGVRTHIAAMFEDERAQERVLNFHRDLLRTNVYADITKNQERFENFQADTGLYMQIELDLFIESLVFEADGGFNELMTSRQTFVNQNLALIYGLEGEFGDDFTEVTLDAERRSGLLTRLGFLASNATSLEQDPIHRGVFVADHILCKNLPAPPDNVPPLPARSGETVRQRVEAHTGDGTCGEGCHSTFINPPGFAFENFDALGQFQDFESGLPVDASDAFQMDGREQRYENAVEFSQLLSDSFEANACYTRHWLEALYGRRATEVDNRLIAPVAEASRLGQFTIVELVTALLLSDAYLTRPSQEDSP